MRGDGDMEMWRREGGEEEREGGKEEEEEGREGGREGDTETGRDSFVFHPC